MRISPRLNRLIGYVTSLIVVLAVHSYALHLDESSETEPTPVAQRQA